MNSSPTIAKISESLLKAQKKMGAATKGSVNPFFHNKYADLGSVIEVCKAPLNEEEITILQPVVGEVVETVLLHSSGEWISSSTKIVCGKPNDPQAQGAAISYARRYGLMSMLSIPAEDDDGEGAVQRTAPKATKPQQSVVKPKEAVRPAMPDFPPEECPVHHAQREWKFSQKQNKWVATHKHEGKYCAVSKGE